MRVRGTRRLREGLLAGLVLLVAGAALPLWARVPLASAAGAGPAAEPEDFWMRLLFGAGWLGFFDMMLLAAGSLAVVAIAIECFWTIRRSVLMPAELADQVFLHLKEGDVGPAEQLCKQHPSFLASVLMAGCQKVRHGYEAAAKAMEAASQEQNARLHRRVEYLNLLGNIGPMVGLLGTVWGMIVAFTKVAQTHGRADPSQLAGGIAHGLYATVIGLIIAVVGLTCYGILRNWVDGLSADCSVLAERVFAPLKQARAGRRAAAPKVENTAEA